MTILELMSNSLSQCINKTQLLKRQEETQQNEADTKVVKLNIAMVIYRNITK